MEHRTFGRTGLRVTACGLGGGGTSQLGLASGSTVEEAVGIVRRAFDLGVNFFDTSTLYGTEEVIGRALEGHRDDVVLSTKVPPHDEQGNFVNRREFRAAVEDQLRKLRTDFIDVFHVHHLSSENYDYCVDELVPELLALRDEGKLRFIGASENTNADPEHATLQRAVLDDCWDVLMASFNFFNQSAREHVFAVAIERQIGIEIMACARNWFSKPDRLAQEILGRVASGAIDASQIDPSNPLSFLEDELGVGSVSEASYRFAAYEPGVHVVLTGTGNLGHLEENVRAFDAGPLPLGVQERLTSMFGHLVIGVERLA